MLFTFLLSVLLSGLPAISVTEFLALFLVIRTCISALLFQEVEPCYWFHSERLKFLPWPHLPMIGFPFTKLGSHKGGHSPIWNCQGHCALLNRCRHNFKRYHSQMTYSCPTVRGGSVAGCLFLELWLITCSVPAWWSSLDSTCWDSCPSVCGLQFF